VLTRGHKTLRG